MRAFTDKNKIIWMLIIQAFILISTAITAVTGILYGASSSQAGDHMIGIGYFKAFTMDSNILAGICALFVVCFAIGSLMKKEDITPAWVAAFQHMTTVCLLLTIVTVVVFLAPMDVLAGKSYLNMFQKDLFFFHLTNPVLAVVSFVFLRGNHTFRRKNRFLGMIPLVIYTIVYILMVVVFKKWTDFYGFTFGGRNYLIPVVVAVIFFVTYLFSHLLIWLNGKAAGVRA